MSVFAHSEEASRPIVIAGTIAAFGLVFASGLSSSPWSFLPEPGLRGDFLWMVVLGAALAPARSPSTTLVAAGLVFAQIYLIATLLAALGGSPLFSDDHSTFFYRLDLLASRFPDVASYSTGWNAGVVTSDVFATGAILLHLLSIPFLWFLPLEQAYNLVIGTLVVGMAPWCLYATARISGSGARTALTTAFLGLGPSLLLTRWALKYGAVPFVLTSYLAPLIYALAWRTVRDGGRVCTVALGATLALAMFWSGSAFLLVPVGLIAFVDPGGRTAGRARLVLAAAGAIAVNLWWVVQYLSLVPVLDFVREGDAFGAPARGGPVEGHAGLRVAWAALQTTNPVLLALTAFAAFGQRRDRSVVVRFLVVAVVLLAAASFGPLFKRHLELDRLALPMSLFLTLPAAIGVRELCRTLSGPRHVLGPALATAALLVTILGARVYLANHSVERFHALTPAVSELVRQIRTQTTGGRTYIAGFVLHDFSNGHAAALQPLSGVPMIAVEPMHTQWWYQDPLPERFRRAEGGFHRYLDLHNVDLVVTKDPEWRRRLERDTAFELLWSEGRYRLFRYQGFPDTWVLEGDAEVRTPGNRLQVRLRSPEATLAFRWRRGLRASAGEASPVGVDGLEWVHVRAPADRWIEVDYP